MPPIILATKSLANFFTAFGVTPSNPLHKIDNAPRALVQLERGALELGQGAVGDAAEFLDEPAMKSKIRTQYLGDRERERTRRVRGRCRPGIRRRVAPT